MIRRRGNPIFRFPHYLVTCFLAVFLLSSCVSLSDPESSQEINSDVVGVVTNHQTIGQTFISRRPRLDGIILWMESDRQNSLLTVELFHTPQDENPLFISTISLQENKTKILIMGWMGKKKESYYSLSHTLDHIIENITCNIFNNMI